MALMTRMDAPKIKLEPIPFAVLYYSLTDKEYVIYPEKSFIDEGLHALYEDKMDGINNM